LRPTCLIYGQDGFDLDVLANLHFTYTRLGFSVAYANRLVPADLLVVQRPSDAPLDLSLHKFVHIFDYVGVPINGLLESIPRGANAHVFTTSKTRMDSLRSESMPFPADNIRNAFIPVNLRRFSNTPRKRQHKVVHIGNFKPYYAEQIDPYSTNFLHAIRQLDVAVWGGGAWDPFIPKESIRGRVKLGQVSGIYSSSDFALGMMYPFQREVTYSGRFWHSPLNGCTLLSEPTQLAEGMPGIRITDYSRRDLREITDSCPDRFAVQRKAKAFWQSQNVDSMEEIKFALRNFSVDQSRSFRSRSTFQTTVFVSLVRRAGHLIR
jgi:hypothetical protein